MGLLVARRSSLSLAVQALSLRSNFPASQISLHPARLTWQAEIQPAPITQRYRLRLVANAGSVPSVNVVAPVLQPNSSGMLPHVYDTGSLCLSQFGDWQPTMLFTDTFIPWAMEWLIFYELWRANGIWYGDGPDRLDPVSQTRALHPYH